MWWDNRDVFYVLICCAYFLFIYLFFFRSNWIRTPPQWPRSCLLPFLICTIFFCRGDFIPQCRYIATHANEYDASCRDHHKVTTFDDHTIFIQWFSWNVSVLIQHRWCPQAILLPLNINEAFTSSIEQMWFWLLNSVDSICRENVRLIFQTYFFFNALENMFLTLYELSLLRRSFAGGSIIFLNELSASIGMTPKCGKSKFMVYFVDFVVALRLLHTDENSRLIWFFGPFESNA